MPAAQLDYGLPSFQLGKQIMDALEDAKLALVMESPDASKWVPKLARAKGDGFKDFLRGIVLATDGVKAAWDAGYRDPPIPEAFDALHGLCAYAAMMFRDNIMQRILDGELSGHDGALALAVLNRFDSDAQALDNAAYFSAQMGEGA